MALPAWALGLHVDLAMPYWNPPRFRLKTDRDLRDWPEKRFAHEGDRFMAVSPDGRAECYYQGGPLRVERLKRYRTHADGRLHQFAPYKQNLPMVRTAGPDWNPRDDFQPGEWAEVDVLCTRQEQGFGGAHVDITMTDGREVTLRGPWHGGCPPGFVEVAYVDRTDDTRRGWRRNLPWHSWGGMGGLFVREDVFIGIFAKFAPHMLLARVDMGRGPRLQAYTHEWGEPKEWHMSRERAQKAAA